MEKEGHNWRNETNGGARLFVSLRGGDFDGGWGVYDHLACSKLDAEESAA